MNKSLFLILLASSSLCVAQQTAITFYNDTCKLFNTEITTLDKEKGVSTQNFPGFFKSGQLFTIWASPSSKIEKIKITVLDDNKKPIAKGLFKPKIDYSKSAINYAVSYKGKKVFLNTAGPESMKQASNNC